MTRPRILDLFCGAGGCSVGYHRAGFDVTGVDLDPMPRYPYEFHQADALDYVTKHGHEYDVIHASPVCHDWSALAAVSGTDGSAELLHRTLELLPATGRPWIVENVVGAPLADQSDLFGRHGTMLCGTMFALRVIRHRLFETSFPLPLTPRHGTHSGEFYSPAGHGHSNKEQRNKQPHLSGTGYADRCRAAMGIDWMNRDELAQAIPPAYTHWIGAQLADLLAAEATA